MAQIPLPTPDDMPPIVCLTRTISGLMHILKLARKDGALAAFCQYGALVANALVANGTAEASHCLVLASAIAAPESFQAAAWPCVYRE
jgi:hypothetical protein